MSAATITELLKLKPLGCGLLVLRRRVVAAFAFGAFKCDNVSHCCPGLL